MWLYVLLMLFLGTLFDIASIVLGVMALLLPLTEALDLSLIWIGIVTMVEAKIGLLTPPLGKSCFVIKLALNDDRISQKDVFTCALPSALGMLLVLIIQVRFPILNLAIL